MNVFLCLLRLDGERVAQPWRTRFLTAPLLRAIPLQMVEQDGFWALAGGDAVGRRPSIALGSARVGVGTVRLDHPAEVRPRDGAIPSDATDMERVLRAWPCDRPSVAALLGDFAFVLHDAPSRSLLAARDAFGVDPLYFRTLPGMLALSSRAELLAMDDGYDRRYLAEFLARVAPIGVRTPYAGVSAVAPAHLVRAADGRVVVERYWSADAFTAPDARPVTAIVADFRERFAAAVRTRMTSEHRTWAQLSGGLDSSSVVAMADTLARQGIIPTGLAGTITLVDRHGTGGDERRYSDAVAGAYGLRNVQLDDWGWFDADDAEPPRTDQPSPAYPMYARDRRLATMVRDAGGLALLTGYGSDHYLGGSAIFLADWAADGRWRDALREAARWAVTGRVSFWTLAFQNILLPLLPGWARPRAYEAARVPSWLYPRVVRELALEERTAVQVALSGQRGRKYATSVQRALDGMPEVLALHAVIQDLIEERHPFLYRPLVELGLCLPAQLCAQPMARKWVLREAMRGILPDAVRTRPGKGSIDGSLSWTLSRAHQRVQALLDDSRLAELDLVDVERMRAALGHAVHGAEHERASILRTLALESWLQVRSGRWAEVGTHQRNRARSA